MSAPTTFMGITNTDPTTAWTYLSEGGATMVFSYAGPPDNVFSGKVLRVRKRSHQAEDDRLNHPAQSPHQNDDNDDNLVAFQDILSELVPPRYLPVLQSVEVSQQWLKKLAGVAEVHRPPERIRQGGIDIRKQKALLATDLVGKDGWAVEIKPKWGFLPSPKHLSPTTRPIKARHCRFCMHSQLKIDKGDGWCPSVVGYCPLDFFSGEEQRVRLSLRCLWDMWIRSRGKTNNLRVFNCGKIVNPADTDSLSAFSNSLRSCYGFDQTFSGSDVATMFTEMVLQLVVNHELIFLLANLQRTLDPLDIEGLSKLWSVSRPGVPFGQGEPDPTVEEWANFVHAYLAGGGVNTLRYEVLSYLLSATFKDCSLILRFPVRPKDGQKPDDTIKVIDLDRKSVSRLAKWEALDFEIVTNFAELSIHRNPCIDAAHKSS